MTMCGGKSAVKGLSGTRLNLLTPTQQCFILLLVKRHCYDRVIIISTIWLKGAKYSTDILQRDKSTFAINILFLQYRYAFIVPWKLEICVLKVDALFHHTRNGIHLLKLHFTWFINIYFTLLTMTSMGSCNGPAAEKLSKFWGPWRR